MTATAAIPSGTTLLVHPSRFKDGARILVLRARNKDNAGTLRTITRASFGMDDFDAQLQELLDTLKPGERIYGSAAARDTAKAMRLFKERELAASYDAEPEAFYRALPERWYSCLMNPRTQAQKLWLFDCDTREDAELVRRALGQLEDTLPTPYEYETKSGRHFIVAAFDRSRIPEEASALIHENALMLWAYRS